MRRITKLLLPVVLLCVLYATTGSARALDAPAATDATEQAPEVLGAAALAPIDDDASANLTCGGHVCLSSQLCCSCRATPSSPLTFFCHTPDYCPHGSICQIPPP
ncbi:MAG TPA: hypothetical protein VLM79_01360 [Kofleriaceae bacterium]|nr:hypothetical protein [Kofleriaceae bacterium]